MNQQQLDEMAEALRAQGLTWRQTNFAVSLVRNAQAAERERCLEICERHYSIEFIAQEIAAEIRGPST